MTLRIDEKDNFSGGEECLITYVESSAAPVGVPGGRIDVIVCVFSIFTLLLFCFWLD